MLADSLFRPLDLDAALDDAYDAGGTAVIDLLESALTDPRARGDANLVEYLDVLVDAYVGAGRDHDAIETLHRIGELEPSLSGFLTARIADLQADLAEPTAGVGPLEQDLAAAVAEHLRGRSMTGLKPQQVIYRMAYLPEPEYAAARAANLLDATMYSRHEDYRREIQVALEATGARVGAKVCVVALDVDGLLAYAERAGKNPASRSTRLDYNDSLQDAGRDIAWPPERNSPCWCGSHRKYKKCCGAPGFTAVEMPDPASLTLKIELDHVQPPVWRRVAAPSNMLLDQFHLLIQAAMGWYDVHMYEFNGGQVSILDPRSTDHTYKANEERLISIAGEVGQQFTYTYDFGDGWSHTITVEEIREADALPAPQILDGGGACPPEDCGGPYGYLALVNALNDPTDARHDRAVELLGKDFDATRY